MLIFNILGLFHNFEGAKVRIIGEIRNLILMCDLYFLFNAFTNKKHKQKRI